MHLSTHTPCLRGITPKQQWPPWTKSLRLSLNEGKCIFFPNNGLDLLCSHFWHRGLLWGWGEGVAAQAPPQGNLMKPLLIPATAIFPLLLPCPFCQPPASIWSLHPVAPSTILACLDAWKNYTHSQKARGRAGKPSNQRPISSFRALPSFGVSGVDDGWMVSSAPNPEVSQPPSALRASSPVVGTGEASGPEETHFSPMSQEFQEGQLDPSLGPQSQVDTWMPGREIWPAWDPANSAQSRILDSSDAPLNCVLDRLVNHVNFLICKLSHPNVDTHVTHRANEWTTQGHVSVPD